MFPTLWPRSSERHAIAAILARGEQLSRVTDFELRKASQQLSAKAAQRDLSDPDLIEALSLVREAARRAHGTPHFPVQLQAGWALAHHSAIEMNTGEGKTLTALLVAYVLALPRQGCHVLTANDYLAERDAEHAAEVFERLGLSVGVIDSQMPAEQRARAYGCDVTFNTVTQAGFDFLRDRVGRATGEYMNGASGLVQRPLAAAVVDEADLVMLDEARTPLQLAVAVPIHDDYAHQVRWSAGLAETLRSGIDFEVWSQRRRVELTEDGCRAVLLARERRAGAAEQLYASVERALEARHIYQRDQDYLVREGKVEIIGPTTGRALQGRQWQNGLHQAIEHAAGVEFSPRTRSNAAITIQALLNEYPRRCGMSGTVRDATRELREIYRLNVVRIPPRLPSQRTGWPTRCFASMSAKLEAIVDEVRRLQQQGRSILVGTPSLETSERLAGLLTSARIVHDLLSARQPEKEAAIVAQAGEPGRVTIATNMAGRGTDIRLSEAARAAGGLHVIVAGMQASPRTDRQLIGRTARQGDPGSYQEFLSWDDELFQGWRPDLVARWKRRYVGNRQGELASRYRGCHRRAQRELNERHSQLRLQLNRERLEIHRWTTAVGMDPYLDWLDEDANAA